MSRERITETIAWRSDDPHLTGNFAPIGSEIDADELEVVAGAIPEDLFGTYICNGPNPRYEPVSYNYPLEGDGMLHAVRFEGGRASYRNWYVRTRGFEIEDTACHAVFGGVMTPRPVDPAYLGPGDDPDNPFKASAFIGVMQHGDHLLALGEGEPAWESGPDLETRGPWMAGTDEPILLGAHNRVHPVPGDLFALSYDFMSPTVTMHHVGRDGRLRRSFDIALAAPSMIHDFVLTEHNLVLLIGPLVFDMEAMMTGGSFLQWRPDIGTRIAVVPLTGGNGASATFNCLLRIDTETGDISAHDFGNRIAGEAVFIPRGECETAGWLATYLYDPDTQTSEFVLLDAEGFSDEPVVRLRLPPTRAARPSRHLGAGLIATAIRSTLFGPGVKVCYAPATQYQEGTSERIDHSRRNEPRL
ncbi:carotenoid oxygenase family protein [Rhodobacterales bacterium]|nr:carotenoid oxygenase family protein [Rhodobacterales bacterium]